MAAVIQDNEPFALVTLIADRCHTLGLSHGDVIRRTPYRNSSKGVRRLNELLAGDLTKTKYLIATLPAALDLAEDVVGQAVRITQQQLDDRKRRRLEANDAAWRTEFEPHAIILTERTRPQPFFVAAVIGVERILRVDLDVTANPIAYVGLALDGLRQKLAAWNSEQLPAFGRPIGIVVNYSPDFAVRFDLDGTAREIFDRAHRIGQLALLMGGQPVCREPKSPVFVRKY
jgi:hypothetical protein